jgi:hypothetical protein
VQFPICIVAVNVDVDERHNHALEQLKRESVHVHVQN